MLHTLKSYSQPTPISSQEGLPLPKILKPQVKSLKNCTLTQSQHSGSQTSLSQGLRGQTHTTIGKTSYSQEVGSTVKKGSIQGLIEKSKFSLGKVLGKCYTPKNGDENDDSNKENDYEGKYNAIKKRRIETTSVGIKRRNDGCLGDSLVGDCLNPQKKLNLTSDEQGSKLHTLIQINGKDSFIDAGFGSNNKTASSSPPKVANLDFSLSQSGQRIKFSEIQESKRKPFGERETTGSSNKHAKIWTIDDSQEMKRSQDAMTTRANSFEIIDCDEDDSFCFVPVVTAKNLESVFQAMSTEENELECEEILNLGILGSSAKKKKVIEVIDLDCEDDHIDFISVPLIDTPKKKGVIDENHFDFLEVVRRNQSYYRAEDDHLRMKQPEITEEMRAVLIDWMIEVCGSFKMKRDTLYVAVSLLDKYLSIVPNIPTWKIQLIGVTSLLIAAKSEEIHPPKLRDFATEEDGYTVDQIVKMEIEMCQTLQWRLNPMTSYTLANYMMTCWDTFMDASAKSHFNGVEKNEFYFKKANIKSYIKFTEVTQILDLFLLDTRTLKYDTMSLVVSIIYFVMEQGSQKMTRDGIINSSQNFKNKENNEFYKIFIDFLEVHLCLAFEDLKDSFQYISPYFGVNFTFEPPSTTTESTILKHKGHYEDFLSSQTHCPSNLSFVKGYVLKSK